MDVNRFWQNIDELKWLWKSIQIYFSQFLDTWLKPKTSKSISIPKIYIFNLFWSIYIWFKINFD